MRCCVALLLLVAGAAVAAAQARAAAGAPLGAWTPVPELPGMGRPVDTAAVAARRRALLQRIGHGTVLIPAAHERDLEKEYVQDNDFRQNNTFFYFTELETQDAWLLLTARGPDSLETVLFLPPRNPSQERWTGLRLGPDSLAARLSGIPTVLPTDSLERELRAARFRGSGPISTTLHYDVNRRQTRDGDLVVVDAGAEWGQYTADVTRTWPVNGRFTPRQKAIYDLVLATQQVAFDSVRPGATMRDLNRVAQTYMREHSGSLCGDQTCDAYFIHSLGHPIGMDVHDVTVPGRLRFEPGMVITLEPGIYLARESLGVRIEDDVLVTPTGAEWLSAKAPRTTVEIERLIRGAR